MNKFIGSKKNKDKKPLALDAAKKYLNVTDDRIESLTCESNLFADASKKIYTSALEVNAYRPELIPPVILARIGDNMRRKNDIDAQRNNADIQRHCVSSLYTVNKTLRDNTKFHDVMTALVDDTYKTTKTFNKRTSSKKQKPFDDQINTIIDSDNLYNFDGLADLLDKATSNTTCVKELHEQLVEDGVADYCSQMKALQPYHPDDDDDDDDDDYDGNDATLLATAPAPPPQSSSPQQAVIYTGVKTPTYGNKYRPKRVIVSQQQQQQQQDYIAPPTLKAFNL